MKKIKVKNSGIVKLQCFNDFPDGNLMIGEAEKSIPFKIKRFYFINNLFNKKSVRGKHAHKKLEQYIFCVNGQFTLSLDDGKNKQNIIMSDPSIGIKLGPLLWHTMSKFTSDCVLLVVASDYYKKDDYIRDYSEFLEVVRSRKKIQKKS